jgi:uncharacterized protein YndB with AHSA1/START domain
MTDRKEVIVLSIPTNEFTVLIEAPVHSVFEHCLDPRGMYVGDPMMKVVEATLTPDGVGTEARLKAETPLFTETVAIEYTEVVRDERIVFKADAVMVWLGRGRGISIATHSLTWTFQPEDGGTRLSLVVVVQNPPLWQRIFDRLSDRAARKMFNGRLARIKAATEEQTTAAS